MDTKAETAYLYTDVMLDVEKYAEKQGYRDFILLYFTYICQTL